METYKLRINLEVTLEAFSQEDAIEAITEAIGEVEAFGAVVTSFELDNVWVE